MATSTPTSNDRLPSTLFTVYQTYKRGTSVVLEWLTTFDKSPTRKPAATKNTPAPVSAPNAVTVKQLLEKARRASKNEYVPPPAVHDAFRIVLVNRHTLTKYYDDLPAASVETKASTLRHKVFNDTLAQAYTILFPPSKTRQRVTKKPADDTPQHKSTPTANSFEALSYIVEEEPDFEACASDFWQAETSSCPVDSTISDDSVGDAVALHAYVTELQDTVKTIKSVWASAAAGEIPLAVAGWLTNVAHIYLIQWVASQSFVTDDHKKLLDSYYPKAKLKARRENDASSPLEDFAGLEDLAEKDDFLEFTHGYGLLWPVAEVGAFRDLVRAQDDSLAIVECRKFEDYFKAVPDQRNLRHEFVEAILKRQPISEVETGHQQDQSDVHISESRYKYDQAIVRSIYRSIHRHPLWDFPYEHTGKITVGWEWWHDQNHIQSPDGVPLLWNLRASQDTGCLIQTTAVIGTYIFLESCRSFDPRTTSTTLGRLNNRIRVLSFTKSVRTAIYKLSLSVKDPYKSETLSKGWLRYAIVAMTQFDRFTSEKSFDLYSQSPWVTGSYMAQITSRSTYLGLKVLNERGYFVSLLHLYKMLRQLRVLGHDILILERLCETLGPTVFAFSNGPPLRDFDKMVRVTNGQPLRGDGNFSLGMAKWKGKGIMSGAVCRFKTEDLSKFADESLSHFWRPSTPFLATITDKRYLTKKHDVRPTILARYPPSEIILRAKDHIMPEFEGPLPLAKIKFFAVMDLVLDVWKEVATHVADPSNWPDYIHTLMDIFKSNPAHVHLPRHLLQEKHVECGIRYLEKVREHVDVWDQTYPGQRKDLREEKGLVLLRDAVVKVCGDVKVEDFLWKDM